MSLKDLLFSTQICTAAYVYLNGRRFLFFPSQHRPLDITRSEMEGGQTLVLKTHTAPNHGSTCNDNVERKHFAAPLVQGVNAHN
jgi:hypothetical protein